jgi:hypothetical protein
MRKRRRKVTTMAKSECMVEVSPELVLRLALKGLKDGKVDLVRGVLQDCVDQLDREKLRELDGGDDDGEGDS